ncbi:MAG: hypothetical protein ISS87_01865 [Candidatus Pacebacteria bacterium]|nr:hypothetical protein [Candidatus Paceibacterota bacterium]
MKKKLPKSIRKYIRKQKAEIREKTSGSKERKELIDALYNRFLKKKSVTEKSDLIKKQKPEKTESIKSKKPKKPVKKSKPIKRTGSIDKKTG